MFFWKRKKERSKTIENATLVKGGRKLGFSDSATSVARRGLRRTWEPRGLGRVVAGPLLGIQPTFAFNGSNRGDFYRWLRDSIPIISAGVWAWVRLCSTKTSRVIEGSASERLRAVQILNRLDHRILESPYGRGSGMLKLTEAYFLELFTTGRFSGEAILTEDRKSIDHFRFIDPYRVGWEHGENGWIPYINSETASPNGGSIINSEKVERFDLKTFFYGTLGTDITKPEHHECR